MLSFNRELRLLTAQDYKKVFSGNNSKAGCAEFLILATPNNLQYPRLGLVVAKKHVKLAVQRNRWKRRMRESFRLAQQTLPANDYVIIARPGLASCDNKSIQRLLDKQWNRFRDRATKP